MTRLDDETHALTAEAQAFDYFTRHNTPVYSLGTFHRRWNDSIFRIYRKMVHGYIDQSPGYRFDMSDWTVLLQMAVDYYYTKHTE